MDQTIKNSSSGTSSGPPSNFVADEIGSSSFDISWLVAARSFENDLVNARQASRDSLYATWNDKLNSSLASAYPLYLHLIGDPKRSEEILADPYFHPEGGARKRRPSKNKPALLALQYVTRPFGLDDQKNCSAYALLLILAKDREILPENFGSAMAGFSLQDGRAHNRKHRRPIIGQRKLRVCVCGGVGDRRYEDIVLPNKPDEVFFAKVTGLLQNLLSVPAGPAELP